MESELSLIASVLLVKNTTNLRLRCATKLGVGRIHLSLGTLQSAMGMIHLRVGWLELRRVGFSIIWIRFSWHSVSKGLPRKVSMDMGIFMGVLTYVLTGGLRAVDG